MLNWTKNEAEKLALIQYFQFRCKYDQNYVLSKGPINIANDRSDEEEI